MSESENSEQLAVDSREEELLSQIGSYDLMAACAKACNGVQKGDLLASEVHEPVGFVKVSGQVYQVQVRVVCDELEWIGHPLMTQDSGLKTGGTDDSA